MVVPASRRADGSVRKTIRIRQGYVPQDVVPKYKPMDVRVGRAVIPLWLWLCGHSDCLFCLYITLAT